MKVLKEGNWKQSWSMEAACPEQQCGAELLVEEEDVKAVDFSSRNDFFALCPICAQHVDVPSESLPLRMQRALNIKRKYRSSSDW